MRIRKRINKRIERDEDGVQVSAAVNAVVAANVGESGSATVASSRQDVAEREARRTSEPEERKDSGSRSAPKVAKERAQELPDREGTYDELREAAADQEANEGEKDE